MARHYRRRQARLKEFLIWWLAPLLIGLAVGVAVVLPFALLRAG